MRAPRLLYYSLFLLVLAVLSVGSVTAQDTKGDTPSGTIGVKSILLDGDVVDGVFEGGGTAHLYRFNASAGDVVSIGMVQSPDGALDPFLVLLGPNGELIASDDDSGTEPFLSSLISDVELPADGSYFIMATSYIYIDNFLVEIGEESDDQEAGETYTLSVNGITPPEQIEGFDPETISFTPLAVGDTVSGESTAEFPVGYYVLDGTQGQTVTITAESDEFDTILHVFGPSGDRIAVNDDDDQGGTLNSAVRDLELPEDGLYLIFATNTFFYNAVETDSTLEYDGGAFTVSVQ